MLSREERKKLYEEIESYRKRVVVARKNLNDADLLLLATDHDDFDYDPNAYHYFDK